MTPPKISEKISETTSEKTSEKTSPLTSPKTAEFYRAGARTLIAGGVPFLVGGTYALLEYTAIERPTKDFDIFLRPTDVRRALDTLDADGFRVELTDERWLAKAFPRDGESYIDLVFGLANGLATVDEEWFTFAPTGQVLGMALPLCPPEEMIWSKSFVAERHRYDGADIAHLLRACATSMDWSRLIRRFADAWRLLLAHLIVFGFIFPSDRDLIPGQVVQQLVARLQLELDDISPDTRICQGTLLSTEQYLTAIERWGYQDARSLARLRSAAR